MCDACSDVTEQVDEQQGRALPGGDQLEEPPYVFSQLHLTEGIGRLGDGDQLSNGHGCAAPAQPKRVQRDAEEVGRWIVDPVDLPPPLPELQECLLGKLLGVVPVPRDEVERSEHAFPFLLEEDVEACLGFDPFRELHDFFLCSHEAWIRTGHVLLMARIGKSPHRRITVIQATRPISPPSSFRPPIGPHPTSPTPPSDDVPLRRPPNPHASIPLSSLPQDHFPHASTSPLLLPHLSPTNPSPPLSLGLPSL